MTVRAIVLFTAALLFGAFSANAASLGNPSALNEKAPAVYKAKFDTSKGTFVIEVHRDWAPNGADRFYNLVKNGFYNDARFFRVISGFMVQFGISGNPDVSAVWHEATIPDDPVKESNKRGTLAFATAGPNSRSTQVFINFNDNFDLNRKGCVPFGRVVDGMSAVGEIYRIGDRPDQRRIQEEGNAYLRKNFPAVTWIENAEYLGEPEAKKPEDAETKKE